MNTLAVRAALACATTATAVSALTVGTANADTDIALPNATVTNKVGDATVTVSITGQRAKLSPGMVALPTTRNAWVSGVVSAKINGRNADGGSISAGYAVGCQIDVGSVGVTAGVTGDSGVSAGVGVVNGPNGPTLDPRLTVEPSIKATTGGSIKLTAGTIGTQMLTYDRAKWPKPGSEVSPSFASPSTGFTFKGTSGSLTYSDRTIGVDGCAGYAQARFFAKVRAKVGNTQGNLILWGKPFTLG